MKATGIVRRIDELGRIVIPKEIRRTQRIRQGDSLEIFTAADGEVVFKKYSPLSGLGSLSKVYAEVLAKSLGRPVVVCDTRQIVAAAGPGRAAGPRHLAGAGTTAGGAQRLHSPRRPHPPPADAGTQRAADFMRRTDLSAWRHRGRRAAARHRAGRPAGGRSRTRCGHGGRLFGQVDGRITPPPPWQYPLHRADFLRFPHLYRTSRLNPV